MIDAQFTCPKCGGAVRVEAVTQEEEKKLLNKILHPFVMDKQTHRVSYSVCQVCGRTKRLK